MFLSQSSWPHVIITKDQNSWRNRGQGHHKESSAHRGQGVSGGQRTTRLRGPWERPGPTSRFTAEEAEEPKDEGIGQRSQSKLMAGKGRELRALTLHPFLTNKWVQTRHLYNKMEREQQSQVHRLKEPAENPPRTWLYVSTCGGMSTGLRKGRLRSFFRAHQASNAGPNLLIHRTGITVPPCSFHRPSRWNKITAMKISGKFNELCKIT